MTVLFLHCIFHAFITGFHVLESEVFYSSCMHDEVCFLTSPSALIMILQNVFLINIAFMKNWN